MTQHKAKCPTLLLPRDDIDEFASATSILRDEIRRSLAGKTAHKTEQHTPPAAPSSAGPTWAESNMASDQRVADTRTHDLAMIKALVSALTPSADAHRVPTSGFTLTADQAFALMKK